MGKDRIEFCKGTVYINGEHFCDDVEIRCAKEPDPLVEFDRVVYQIGQAAQEFTCSIKMATDAYVRFAHAMLGIDLALAEMCPNRRVVHLAKHAKKKRTRKKNYNRMIRECERRG